MILSVLELPREVQENCSGFMAGIAEARVIVSRLKIVPAMKLQKELLNYQIIPDYSYVAYKDLKSISVPHKSS